MKIACIQIVEWRWQHQRHQCMHLKDCHYYSFHKIVSKTFNHILFTVKKCQVRCVRLQGAKRDANTLSSRITV